MNIAYASSEVVPYSKTGGLADVAGALSSAIARLGHEVRVFTPYYRATRKLDAKAKPVAEGSVPVGSEMLPWMLLEASAPRGAKTYFISNERYFDRDGLYGTPQGDYEDSCSRFVFFSRACIAAAEALGTPVDVWHCHDWQTSMIPVYLKLEFADKPFHASSASVLTIHNLAYQGQFWHWDWPLLNLPWQHFNWRELEFHGKMNLLKGALIYSDVLVTISPTYAREIQTPEGGWRLDGVLSNRKDDLFGIVNGIDTEVWDPARDALLPAAYSAQDLEGKKACKEALRQRLNLPGGEAVVIGMIGRLFEQKGFDLVAEAIDELLRRDVQLVILGTGREEFHHLLQRVQQNYPNKVAVAFAFDNALAHLIEAGSDVFLMPSRYEPCGLNQLYSLAYGTPPIVRNVGGLADTITDATPETLADGTATGFKFMEYSAGAMLAAVDRALECFTRQAELWRKMQLAGMSQDWSWKKSAGQYLEVYDAALKKVRKTEAPSAVPSS